MKSIRTDLAMEYRTAGLKEGEEDGVIFAHEELFGFPLTETEVCAGKGEEISGKKAGLYLSLETGRLWQADSETRRRAVRAVRSVTERLMPEGEGPVLVAGLGNADITADAIGQRTVKRLVVTHHMKSLCPDLYAALELGDMAAVMPCVLGQTGVESAALVRAAAEQLHPRCLIAVDALAARSLTRLGTTVQFTRNGISPGSGVCNAREELSEQTMGCPVLAIGVPTVVDATTLLADARGSGTDGAEGCFVTPKEADLMIRVLSEVLALAINGAVHGDGAEEYAPL